MARSSTKNTQDSKTPKDPLEQTDQFLGRHIGPDSTEVHQMLDTLGYRSLEELIEQTIPASIRMAKPLELQDEVLFTRPSQRPFGEQGTLSAMEIVGWWQGNGLARRASTKVRGRPNMNERCHNNATLAPRARSSAH